MDAVQQRKLTKFEQALKDALKQSTDGLTREEFEQAFKAVLTYVQTTRKTNADEFTVIRGQIKELSREVKDSALKDITDAKGQISVLLAKALTDQAVSLNFLRDKARSITQPKDGYTPLKGVDYVDGTPGVDGKDGSPDTGEQIIEKINSAEGLIFASAIGGLEEHLTKISEDAKRSGTTPGWGAHKINVYQSSTLKSDGARHLNFTGATVTESPDGITTVAITGGGGGGGTLTSETPGGTIDGSNKTFTVANTPVQLFLNGALQVLNDDYTVSGLTITFVVAPTPASTTPLTSWYFSSAAQGTPKGEAPTGTINSVNKIFTLSQTPSPASFLQLYLGRQLQIGGGVDYTLSGTTITYVTAPDISLVGLHYAYYLY